MNVKILTLVIVLLVSLLCSASAVNERETQNGDNRPASPPSWSHGLHGAWQRTRRGLDSEKNGPAKPCKGRSDPQTSRVEEETPTAPSFPQGAHAILEQGNALSAHPQVLISMLFLCLGGPCNEGPMLAQPEE